MSNDCRNELIALSTELVKLREALFTIQSVFQGFELEKERDRPSLHDQYTMAALTGLLANGEVTHETTDYFIDTARAMADEAIVARKLHLPWTEHDFLEEDDSLPVPRLELFWEEGDFARRHNLRCRYRLVYRHRNWSLIGVPLGETLVDRSRSDTYPEEDNKIMTPLRDGRHIEHDSRQLNLPAFVRWKGRAERIGKDD